MERKLYLYFGKSEREMATVDLKKNVLDYVNSADDRLLKMIKALVESYRETEGQPELSEAQKRILDQRLADHKANPNSGREWSEVKSELRAKYGA